MSTSTKKPHRAWLVLIACILFQGATTGIMFNCLGLFYSSICTDLGFTMGSISLYSTIRQIATAAVMPYLILLLKKKNMHWYLLAATLVCGLCFGMMGSSSHLYQFYINGALTGIAGSIVFGTPITIMINNWFQERKSFALGLAFSASGLAGVITNPLCSWIILETGWRAAAWIMAAISMALAIPSVLFVLRNSPAQLGLEPFGANVLKADTPTATKKTTGIASISYTGKQAGLITLCCLLITAVSYWLSQYNGHLVTFGKSCGLSLMAASTVASFAMVGNVASKVLLGIIGDRWGYKAALGVVTVVSALSFLIFLLLGHTTVGLYLGGLLFGFTMAMVTIIPPMLASNLYAKEDYEKQYGRMSTVGYLASASGFFLIGTSYDMFGSYLPSMAVALGLCCLAGLAGIVISRITKRGNL